MSSSSKIKISNKICSKPNKQSYVLIPLQSSGQPVSGFGQLYPKLGDKGSTQPLWYSQQQSEPWLSQPFTSEPVLK